MRVNIDVIKKHKRIDSLAVGWTFLTQRTNSKELGLYMVVDNNSGLARRDARSTLAVNLSTGQLRSFYNDIEVEPVDTEVNVSSVI